MELPSRAHHTGWVINFYQQESMPHPQRKTKPQQQKTPTHWLMNLATDKSWLRVTCRQGSDDGCSRAQMPRLAGWLPDPRSPREIRNLFRNPAVSSGKSNRMASGNQWENLKHTQGQTLQVAPLPIQTGASFPILVA